MTLVRFEPDDLRAFLRCVDRHLTANARIEIIGGSAAALAHGAQSTTSDIDTFHQISDALAHAVSLARAETGLDVPLVHAAIADVPYNYQDRLSASYRTSNVSKCGRSRGTICC